MLAISIFITKTLLLNSLNRAVIIINIIRLFQSFIADTVGWWKKYNGSLKKLLQQGISEPQFYGDLVDWFRKIVGKSNFSQHFRKFINRYQRTSGPVNAHLTPGPGIYFNAFIQVYSPRPVADNPLGTNVDVNRKPLSLCPFVASFKTISLKQGYRNFEIQIGPFDRWLHRRHRNMRPIIPNSHKN